MKPKLNPVEHLKVVHYQWTSNGVTHKGRTVIGSSTRAGLRQAMRRFFRTNDHVQPAEAA